jgi:hypothetical protein
MLVGTVCAECIHVNCIVAGWIRLGAVAEHGVPGFMLQCGRGNIPGACCFLAEVVHVRTLTVDIVAFISVSSGVNEHEHVT